MKCELPPPGWHCTRPKGHEGPCAARATEGDFADGLRSLTVHTGTPAPHHPYLKRHQREAIAIASSAEDIEVAIVISLSNDGRHTFSVAGMMPDSPRRAVETLRKVLDELEAVERKHGTPGV